MLLALDTSSGTSVAVVDADAGIVAERSETDTMRHAELIGTMIAGVLADATIERSALTAVVAGMGPGPFTGLRVGIAAARAFALGLSLRVLPAVSHDALAWAWYRDRATDRRNDVGSGVGSAPDLGHDLDLVVITDARRREVYWSRYTGCDRWGFPLRDGMPALARPADLDARLEAESTATDATGTPSSPHRLDAASVSAGALGMVAALATRHHRADVPDEPLYLRSPDVTLAAPKRVSA